MYAAEAEQIVGVWITTCVLKERPILGWRKLLEKFLRGLSDTGKLLPSD